MHWGEQFEWREKVHQRYHYIWGLKIVKKRLPFILKYLKDGESVLEIGAHNRGLEPRIKEYCPHILYKSMDIDPTYAHDYSSFQQIKEKFDMVLLFEVIEHLDLDEGVEMMAKIYGVLNYGGRVIISTPNIYTPGQYWKGVSHRTPYHYEELGGVLLSQHFEIIDICRLFNAPFLKFVIKTYFFSPIFRFFGIDFTKSILIVARKS